VAVDDENLFALRRLEHEFPPADSRRCRLAGGVANSRRLALVLR
jgi:hypothetical protein